MPVVTCTVKKKMEKMMMRGWKMKKMKMWTTI